MTDDGAMPPSDFEHRSVNGWVKIPRGSWHLQSGLVSRGGMIHTLCGRWAPQRALTSTFLIVNEKSCERCAQLREYARVD